MKVSLTIFLLRPSIVSFEAAVGACNLAQYTSIDAVSAELGGIAKCFAKSTQAKPPRWVSFYQEGFAIPPGLLRTKSSSVVVIIKESERFFAITSGQGHHSIPRNVVESDFGLKATLNAVAPGALRSLQSRTIDPLTVQRLEVSNRNTSLQSFVLDQERELLAKLEGIPEDQADGLSIAGSNSVQLHRDTSCASLPSICGRLLTLSRKRKYKDNFGFIDQIKRVVDDSDVNALNAKLASQVESGGDADSVLSLALPSIEGYAQIDRYVAKLGRSELGDLGDLSMDDLSAALEQVSGEADLLNAVRIVAVDAEGKQVAVGVLADWLVAEIKWRRGRYVFSAGEWYQVSASYVEDINQQLSRIGIIKSAGYLPSMILDENGIESEGKYNARCASRDRLCLDQKNIQMDRWGRVEACDLFTSGGHFIHVKKQTSSGTLSHLWSQGLVSAQLLVESKDYRKKLRKKLGDWAEKIPLDGIEPRNFTVVYAIATSSDKLPDCLPFFSRVNLAHNARHLARLGYVVKLRKIDYVEA